MSDWSAWGVVIDCVLAIVLILNAISGYRQGVVVAVMSLIGFLGGGAIGLWAMPAIATSWQFTRENRIARIVVVVVGVFLLASVLQGVAVNIGNRVRSKVHAGPARVIDASLGAIVIVTAVAVLVWFVAGAVRPAAPPAIAKGIGDSRLLRAIDAVVPARTTELFADFRRALDSGGFPRVFEGVASEPIVPAAPPDRSAIATDAVRAAAASMVRVTGNAPSCNRSLEGSAWVVAPHRVVTNAHVVAGVTRVGLQVQGTGRVVPATVVAFDAKRDLALLDAPDLTAPSLPLGDTLGTGADIAVAGFPLDGPYRVEAGRVRSVISATGADIYGQPGVTRSVYSMLVDVEPGNSGGPVLDPAGEVVGVVFARSLDDTSTGYALTMTEVRGFLDQAGSSSSAVSTGACSIG